LRHPSPRQGGLPGQGRIAEAGLAELTVPAAIPLELNAAMAWEEAERPDLARARVLEYLDREPEGAFVDRARAQLARLEQARIEQD
ncbi:MAG: hypothetical protein AAFZ65_14975, partial [Planctomycetota bacterium]